MMTINLNTAMIRRLGIGALIGLLLVIIYVLLSHNTSTNTGPALHSEVIKIIPTDKVEGRASDDLSNEHIIDNKHVNLYPFFAKHKSTLSRKYLENIRDEDYSALSIILNDIGKSRRMVSLAFEKLPKHVTIGLSPYVRNHNDVANKFHKNGFEVWMDIASLTLAIHSDKGDSALNPTNNFEWNIKALSQQLKNKDKLAGLILPPQSLIIQTSDLWRDLTYDLFADGYGILDNTSDIIKPTFFFHEDLPAPYIKGDVVIGRDYTITDIKDTLETIKIKLLRGENMIVTIPASTPTTLDILSQWLDSIENDNITLVPLSAQAKL